MWETCEDKNYLPIVYANITALLNDQKEHNKALEYGNRALSLAQEIEDKYSVINCLINLANTYGFLKRPDKEYDLLKQALPLAKKGEDIDQIATVYHNMGDHFFAKKDFTSSLERYLASYAYVKQMGNKYHLCTICSVLAQVYYKLNENGKA